MYRVLFRIGVLTAAIVVGGTALAAARATDAPARALAATHVTDPDEYCLLVGGYWYCYETLDGDQSSSESDSSNS